MSLLKAEKLKRDRRGDGRTDTCSYSRFVATKNLILLTVISSHIDYAMLSTLIKYNYKIQKYKNTKLQIQVQNTKITNTSLVN